MKGLIASSYECPKCNEQMGLNERKSVVLDGFEWRCRKKAKRNRRATSTRVQSMVTASIVKAISAATVCRKLHMNGLYARVSRVCVPLAVQSRGARLKWCRKHGNWTVSDWGNVIFPDESRFALEPDDKRIRIWRKQ
ncbi:HTH_Tnp_Tc3_2 domain-containing protein [Trichonephila clavipes]|nr:HTH_Tnp_Tc3_2 domain-containing protein [Trichonephila clavipes]